MTSPRLSRLLLAWMPPLVLVLLPCVLLWHVVFLHEVFLPADLLRDVAPWRSPSNPSPAPWVPLQWDGIAEFYPWRAFAASTLRHGWLPLWNPYQFCGTPFVANSQSAVFYPLNLIFVWLPTPTAFGVSALLHLALTGLLMYGFLRSTPIGLGRPAATLGAVAWQLSTWQVCWLALPTFLCVSSWLPLALWLTDRLAVQPTLRRAAALGLCLGVMLLGGHLQVALYCLLLIAGYGLFRAIPLAQKSRILTLHYVGVSILALALMLGVAAPQLLPTIELSRLSHRAGASLSWSGYSGYVKLAMPPLNLVTLFLPGFFGSPTQGTYWGVGTNGGPGTYMENACYVGVLALLLAVVGIALTWRSAPATRLFTVAAILALLMALGTPLDALLFFGIPGFAQSGSPARILVLWTFCTSVLAAIGANALLERSQTASVKPLLGSLGVFVVLFMLALGVAVAWVSQNAPSGTLAANLSHETDLWRLPTGVLLGALAVLYLRQRGTLSNSAAGGGLVVLAAVDLLGVNIGFNRTTTATNVFPITPAIAFLQQHIGTERIMPINRRWSLYQPPPAVLPPNAATVYGLRDLQGYDSLLTGQYIRWAARLDGGPPAPPENGNMVFTYGTTSSLAEEAAARYLVSLGPLPADVTGLKLVFMQGETYIYEDLRAQARVRPLDGVGKVIAEDLSPTRLRVQASGVGSGSIVVADQWYPGWEARVDGRLTPIDRGPDIFRTIHLAAQRQPVTTVELRYLPTSFRLGLYAFCLALGLTSASVTQWALAERLRRRRLGHG